MGKIAHPTLLSGAFFAAREEKGSIGVSPVFLPARRRCSPLNAPVGRAAGLFTTLVSSITLSVP